MSRDAELGLLQIAIGNPLRGDDGAAHKLLQLVPIGEQRSVLQLTPEIAAEIARFRTVVLIDADQSRTEPCIEPVVRLSAYETPLAHAVSPAEVVGLAERLYGFSGSAFLCRLPAVDFGPGERLSPFAEAGVHTAAAMLRKWLKSDHMAHRGKIGR